MLIFFLILVALLVYLVCKFCQRKCGKFWAMLKVFIEKKLFYSSPIRYIIISYIKLLNQFLNFLCLAIVVTGSWFEGTVSVFFVVGLMIWPLWTLYFQIKNHDKLEDK